MNQTASLVNAGVLCRQVFVDSLDIITASKDAMGTFTGTRSSEQPDFSRTDDDVSVVGGVENIALRCW